MILYDVKNNRPVVDNQNSQLIQVSHGGERHAAAALFCEIRGEPERRTFSQSADHADIAIHQFDELLADREPQPGAAVLRVVEPSAWEKA